MMANIKSGKVLVFGTFDGLHDGHRFFLRQAKKYGKELVAAVASDEVVKKLKKHAPASALSERMGTLENEKLADKIVAGDRKIGSWKILKSEKPDVVCLGYDQKNLRTAVAEKIKETGWPIKIVSIAGYKKNQLHSGILNKKISKKNRRQI